MKTLLLALLLTPLFYFTQSNEWILVATSSNDAKRYVKNIKKENSDTYSCWTKTVFPAEKYKNKYGKIVTKTKSYNVMEYWTIYCNSNQYAVSDTTVYYSDGRVKSSFDAGGEIKNPIPDSVAEAVVQQPSSQKLNKL